MAEASLATRLAEALEPVADSNGLELVAVEVAGAQRNPIVRVYLDREGGINLDVIAEANAWVGEIVENEIAESFTLEVSSPGIERPLTRLSDFERFVGNDAVMQTNRPIGDRRKFTGRIVRVEGGEVVMDVDGTEHRIPHEAISKARLRVEIDFGQEGSSEAR